ncbi:MAG: LysM peptidoglycan-binding domain-containing protein [Clostridia bacterium]|nr:LysM peptidoglycan-binding domain-containing protein [Clostridia bacterium]
MNQPYTPDTYTPAGHGRATVQVPLPRRMIETELSGDFTLPDYHPEIKRLLRIDTHILPPETADTECTVEYYVLYMGHDNAVYCAPLETTYRTEGLLPDGTNSLSLGEPLVLLCDTTADTPQGRVIAPRRLHIRTKLRSAVKAYGECPIAPTGLPDGADDTLCTLADTANICRVYEAAGDPLPMGEDILLPPPTGGEWRLVCAEARALVTDTSVLDGAVLCRGEVAAKMTLAPAAPLPGMPVEEDAESGAPSPAMDLTILRRKIPFSVTVPLPGAPVTVGMGACARVLCTELSAEMEEGHLHLDLTLLPRVRAHMMESVPYIKDLYSTAYHTTTRARTYPTEAAGSILNGNFTLSDSLPLADTDIDPSARIVDMTATATPEELRSDSARGRCILTGTCHACLLLARDGEYSVSHVDLPFRYEFESAEMGDEPIEFEGAVDVWNCRARTDGERLALDAELAVSLRTHAPSPLTALSEATVDPADPVVPRRGEYIICFPASSDTLWSVAKQYRVPVTSLASGNGLTPTAGSDTPDALGGAGYLII